VTTDEELLRRYRGGDAAAFNELLARHQSRVFGFLVGMLDDRALAEDLFQETFVRFAREASRGKIADHPDRWLFAVANRFALDALRRRNRWKMVRDGAEITAAFEDAGAVPAPDDNLTREETAARLKKAIAALPPEQRQVVLLKKNSDLTFQQIAEAQGVPLGTVLARMHRALKTLRKHLSNQLVC
jgi:RNA polymerase sigma-70 factor (ECF subfamily)